MRSGTAALAAILALAAGPIAPAVAQPAPAGPADLARAKDLYVAGQREMDAGRFTEALRDFGAVYDITKDPVLFFKLGKANEGAGKCDVAIVYYTRYVREAKPTPDFVASANARISACGGTPVGPGDVGGINGDGTGTGTGTGTGGEAGTGTGTEAGTGTGTGTGTGGEAGTGAETGTGTGTGGSPEGPPHAHHRGPWVLVGTSIAFLTIGAVLAYSANATESDLDDLYVSANGSAPVFDPRTQAQYDDLHDQGTRYERLSWISFGLGGATAITAGIWYATQRHPTESPSTSTALRLVPTRNGLAAFGRF